MFYKKWDLSFRITLVCFGDRHIHGGGTHTHGHTDTRTDMQLKKNMFFGYL